VTKTGKTSRRSTPFSDGQGMCQACEGPLDSDGFCAGKKRVRPDNESLVESL
jgi:hypothetical protein